MQDEGLEREVVTLSKKTTERPNAAQDNHELMNEEKSTIAALRSIVQEMIDLVRMRKREEDVLRVDYSRKDDYTSTTGSSAKQQDNINSQKKKVRPKHLNYLSPYLLHVSDEHNITRKEAIQIKTACLAICKERLLQRADIMQHRLNEEGSKLARIQEEYRRNPDKNEQIKSDFIKACEDLTFRIKVLEKRLQDHEELAVNKYKVSHSNQISLLLCVYIRISATLKPQILT